MVKDSCKENYVFSLTAFLTDYQPVCVKLAADRGPNSAQTVA